MKIIHVLSKYSSKNICFYFVHIPVLLWTALGVSICYLTSGSWYNYTAVLTPPSVVMASYLVASKKPFKGGILLISEGIIISYYCLKYLTTTQNLLMNLIFTFPIVLSGITYIVYWFRHEVFA
ncbi:DUF7670 domain-containing protein [Fonticella tunisiensis]|uniref:DUF7670 domain-containing protein n=1 Tax=Fonticella tunisiensis TaxID=1096341 RepID=A0A4R7KRB0_9CLOT|nr:hypothetical protein [Fonticella tunisiensis]TDT61143.1 hypothetical protein EDD71_10840 [Fonticella tunisiensis]